MPASPFETAITTYAPIGISVLALIVAALSLWISRLNYRRAVLAERPIASATLRAIDQTGWYRVNVVVENRSPVGQRWTEIEFRRPRGARAFLESEAYAKNADVNGQRQLMSPLPQDQAKRTVLINTVMKKHGEGPSMLAGFIRAAEGDSHSRSFIMFVPSSRRSKSLSIRVILLSTEAVERKTLVDIHRTLPQATSTAPA